MNRKFRVNNYEIVTNFKNDNNLYIAVQDIQTEEYFLNETVQLMRIKKDTVFATLEKKSEKNLKCTLFIYMQVNLNKLLMKMAGIWS